MNNEQTSLKKAKIRNFSIISHINHGKSTLSDRFLELTQNRQHQKINKLMDSMELEQERGITIKLNTARLNYELAGNNYQLNLIDTPGHVDFTYEVSRSLMACEGAVLLIDAAQGIQAQTLSNLNIATQKGLKILPVINKIDLKYVEIEKVKNTVSKLLNVKKEEISLISAKNNLGITELLKKIVTEIPAPEGTIDEPLKALIFDAYYDRYQGATILVRIINGSLKIKDKIEMIQEKSNHEIVDLFIKTPELKKINQLNAGEVGLVQANIKNINEIQIGDTIRHYGNKEVEAVQGYKKISSVVFANFFSVDNSDLKNLHVALNKIALNDASFMFNKISTATFGNGFHCGFLGLLHLEIIRDRVIREHNIEIIITSPSVKYHFINQNGKEIISENLMQIENWGQIKEIKEPVCEVNILTPIDYLGEIMELIKKKRGTVLNQEIIDDSILKLTVYLSLAEIIIDFFDLLKSISNGYASFDYQINHYATNKLVKMDILVNGKVVDAFSRIVHNEDAYRAGRNLCEKLKKMVPQQNFQISLQAAINSKIIARENISALRKAVADKCYGGDISRKKKLWSRQKKGKAQMKKFGKVEIPYKIFLEVLKSNY